MDMCILSLCFRFFVQAFSSPWGDHHAISSPRVGSCSSGLGSNIKSVQPNVGEGPSPSGRR